jgi:outer membrane protein assembly factor BamB
MDARIVFPFAVLLLAADWPQFLGPQRNGVAPEAKLLTSWPKSGPTLLWENPVGAGFSGPVVAGESLILFHRADDKEIVECWDAATGKGRWKYGYPTHYRDSFGFDEGPRATPVVAGEHVYTLGAEGHLHCLQLADGRKVWERNVNTDYSVRKGFFGVGCSPIVENNLVCVNVGGAGAGIVAFDRLTGKEVWKATDHEASYASPVAATIDGQRHLVFFTREGVVSLDPANGRVRFSQRWRPLIRESVNAASPLIIGDLVFVSTSYNTGALLLKVRQGGPEEVWKDDDSMSNHYNTCVQHKGYLFGLHGRQEYGVELRCVELLTGKVRWSQGRFGCASLILAGDHLLALTEKGDLVVCDATPEGYHELARARLLSDACRAHPALAGGRFYARDAKRLICLDLRKPG